MSPQKSQRGVTIKVSYTLIVTHSSVLRGGLLYLPVQWKGGERDCYTEKI